MQMNCSPSRARLGQMLFSVLNRLCIVHKVRVLSNFDLYSLASQPQVGHITCDNVKNNDTMLDKFAHCFQIKTGMCYDVKCQHIRYVPLTSITWISCLDFHSRPRCLAHIINLATQAIISTCTKSKYYNGDPTDDQLPKDAAGAEHDKIGIVRAICIKVCTVFSLAFGANSWACRHVHHHSIRRHLRASNCTTT